jgi:hypothetical protein
VIVFAIPVASDDVERAGETFRRWREMGYATAAMVDGPPAVPNCDCYPNDYTGWASAVNWLARRLDFDWLVTGGADVLPDPIHAADQIAAECVDHFRGTFGVMQPAGDQYGAIATRTACVSPWMGREWCQRINGGLGPLWAGYRHFYADASLMDVAERLGRLWWRPDLSQFHDHWARRGDAPPDHIQHAAEANAADKALYEQRKRDGFPGSEPLPAGTGSPAVS